jgi:predicted lipoprotein with Yx(FWY)xxD motif
MTTPMDQARGRRAGRGAVLLAGAALAATTLATALAAPASAHGSSSGHTLMIKTVKVPKVGTVLSTKAGLTLYRFTSNPTGASTCTGACAQEWPPLLLPKGDHLKGPHGLKGLSTIHLAHGHAQVAFKGAALYRFVGDKKQGQAKGQGAEGMWFAVVPSTFKPMTTPTSSTTPTSATTTPTTSTSSAPSSTNSTPATSPVQMTTPTTPTTSPPPPTTTPSPPPTTTTTAPPTGGAGF